MNRLKTVGFIIISVIAIQANAQWISLDSKTQQNPLAPNVTLLSNDDTSSVIKIDVSGFTIENKTVKGIEYQTIGLLTDIRTNEVGSPDLPKISRLIAIPDNSPVSVEVIEVGDVTKYDNITILPTRESWYEGADETDFAQNNSVYQSNNVYPTNQTEIDNPVVFRDFRIVRLSVSPVRYIASKKELQVASSITVRLKYDGIGEVINPKLAPRRPIAPSYDRIYRSSIFNYSEMLNSQKNINVSASDLMLCIVPDVLYDDFLPYAEWKRQSGTDIHITKFSDIGATSSNPTIIKNHISDAYHNWDKPPTHVLLVGDDQIIPVKIINYDYSFAYENYFVEVDGADYFPDMMIGRFTHKYNYRLQVMVNKFKMYEKEPFIDGSGWFTKGICASNNAYASQVTTKEFTRDLMLNDGNFTTVDALMSTSPCTSTVADVVNAINDGRSFLNYRGEGWSSGWWASCTPFTISDFPSIDNGRKHTFFTSIGCGVAMFNSSSECFGEKLVEMGTPEDPEGAIAFVGPTSNTHTTYNNKIDKGIYVGMFQEQMETPGEGLARGCLYMYNVFGGGDSWVEYHYRVYAVLGDPSIHIWKEIPLAVDVDHLAQVPAGVNDIEITVTYQDSGSPANNAQVTITGENDLFVTGFTDVHGLATLSTTSAEGDILQVTVRGGDIIPYQGNINSSSVGVDDIINGITRFISIPNPFSSEIGTELNYMLSNESNTSIKIYNVNGQLVRNLQSEMQSPGSHSVKWDGQNDNGSLLNAGVYYCQLVSGNSVQAIKLLMTN